MVKIVDKKPLDSVHIWHSKCKDPDIYFRYSSTWRDNETFGLSISECEELYVKLGELLIKAKNYVPIDEEDED